MTLKKGFALLSPERRREISSKGGKSGKGHRFTREEAILAGRKGGSSLSKNRDYMRVIGSTGSQAARRHGQQEERQEDCSQEDNGQKAS